LGFSLALLDYLRLDRVSVGAVPDPRGPFRRDHKTSGWVKAIWVAFLILFPWITALIYLIARGKGMAERAQEAAAGAKKEADDYIRQAAGRSPVQEIADAKALLEAGTITQAEFESQKAKSLS
jgi:hypothetical protein